jgi:hypothetical protein
VPPVHITSPRRLPLITLNDDGRISANIEARPLDDVLRSLLEKNLIEFKGVLPLGTMVTTRFADFSPEQALREIMQGYNYALIRETAPDKLILVVISRSKRDVRMESEIVGPTIVEKHVDTPAYAARDATEVAKLQHLCRQVNRTDQAALSKRPEVLITLSERTAPRAAENQGGAPADENMEVEAETISAEYSSHNVPRIASTTKDRVID